jgi:tRNA threonylcarbamoyladenosine biosynthesis protein TsaE
VDGVGHIPPRLSPQGRPVVYESGGLEQTYAIAAALAERAGGCIALRGELGSGKTQFVRGLVRGLGGNPRAVSSPTFVLLHVYPTPARTVYHLDAYRVAGPEDFAAIGFDELLEQGGLVVVEWADRVAALLPSRRLDVTLTITGARRRRIEVLELTG